MIKKLVVTLLVVVALCAASYGGLVWNNNRSATAPSQQDVSASWEKSVSWLMNNRETILRDKNPALWWMVGQAAEVSGDSRLQALYEEFRSDYVAKNAGSIWEVFFSPSAFWGVNVPHSAYAGMVDYQQYFLFSLTCGKDMAEDPVIVAQHDTKFCPVSHPTSPACITHQLMGFRFQQRTGCDRVAALDEKVAGLQDMIESQLTWDPRVVDVYLQRVLMLIDSGAPDRVRPRWMQRVLEAQLSDGSWSNMQPLVPVGGGRYFGFDARLAGVGPVRANFHATAQGVWLTSLLRRAAVQTTAAEPVGVGL
jgi:hypothetical protein